MTASTPMYGHAAPRAAFLSSLSGGRLHHAWLLAGPKGLGKATFASDMASRLLDIDASMPSADLLAARTHPDFRVLQRIGKGDKEARKSRDEGIASLDESELKRNISVDQVRGLQSLLNARPSISRYRAIVIDAMDDLEKGGANALLKNLEEPPPNTVFLLVSHFPDALLPTIRSRCQTLRFDPLSDADMTRVLRARDSGLADDDLSGLLAIGSGSPGRAIQYADAAVGELEQLMRDIVETGDVTNAARVQLVKMLAPKAAAHRYRAFLERAPSMIAQTIRRSRPDMNRIAAWREATDLAATAQPKSLDHQAVVFRIASLMGSLAPEQPRA